MTGEDSGEDDEKNGGGLKSETCDEDRKPMVEGKNMWDGPDVSSRASPCSARMLTYWVRARGGGDDKLRVVAFETRWPASCRCSREVLRHFFRCARGELDGKEWLTGTHPSSMKSSTSFARSSKSSIHRSCAFVFFRIRRERPRARASSMRSEDWSTSSTFDSELCAVMEECNKAFESSRALTLRSNSESKNVSDCDARP